jgi:hypothetical protein
MPLSATPQVCSISTHRKTQCGAGDSACRIDKANPSTIDTTAQASRSTQSTTEQLWHTLQRAVSTSGAATVGKAFHAKRAKIFPVFFAVFAPLREKQFRY